MAVRKLKGSAIQSGTITTTQLSSSVNESISAGGGPKVSSLTYPGDDTAANTAGGQTIRINGTGFASNSTVYVNGNAVASVTYNSSSNLVFTTPALSAATYPIYVINPEDGATAIFVPGLQISGEPTWSTSTPLTTQDASIAWNIQLVANSDSTISYSLQAGSSLPDGITLAANGLISGTMSSPPVDATTYNFTVVAVDLEQQDASRAFSVSVTVATLDPYFPYTTLLLHGDGTNNANNHAFVDSSDNAFAITRNGNASQGTFSPFGDNWSNYFDGTGDYLNFTNQATTGDFTCECWFYRTGNANGTYQIIFGGGGTTGATNTQLYAGDDGSIGAAIGSTVVFSRTGTAVVSNQWNHLAWVRSGTTVAGFVNGNRIITGTSSAALNVDRVGGQFSGYEPIGYISNARITTSALYNVSATSVTIPSTPLTAISNTYVLTCQSNAFVDKGPNRLAITRNGNTQVSKFNPFKPYKAVPASYGVYFDGSGDYLSIAANTALALDSSNFTIEAWVYADSAFATDPILESRSSSSSSAGYAFLVTSDGKLNVYNSEGFLGASTTALQRNIWYHVALVRSGTGTNETTFYINGTSSGTITLSANLTDGSTQVTRIGGSTSAGENWNGYISNLRVLKGTALYTSNFTPPTAPLTAIANTSLLTCQSTTIIDNSTNAFTITRNGNAVPTDLNPFTTIFVSEKYNTANGGGAVYFDGSGDYLLSPASANVEFNPSNGFTVEGWVHPLSTGAFQFIVSSVQGTGGFESWWFVGITSGGNWRVSYGGASAVDTGTAVVFNTWSHFALSSSGTNTKFFVNGVLIGNVNVNQQNTNMNLTIGNYSGTTQYMFKGYISNLRYVKGIQSYTEAFIPPTAPLTNIANTSLLLNFTNAGIIDSVGKNVLETVGDAKISTAQSKFGDSSMYFDGNGDVLSIVDDEMHRLTSGDFTIECWVYPTANGALYDSGFASYGAASTLAGWFFGMSGTNTGGTLNRLIWSVNYSASGGAPVYGNAVLPLNTWTHAAVTKVGTTINLFINGVLDKTATVTATPTTSASYKLYIGAASYDPTGTQRSLTGYIDDLRITKGVARYRYNFTPPTKAFNDGDGSLATLTSDVLVGDQVNTPVFPYTTLLLHGDGANNANNQVFVDSSDNAFAITRNGNATQGTFSPFSQTGWGNYFDGSGDYLSIASNTAFNIESNDACVECWVYFNTTPTTQIINGQNSGTGSTMRMGVWSGTFRYTINDDTLRDTGIQVIAGVWYHLCLTITGGVARYFINGILRKTDSGLGSVNARNESYFIGAEDASVVNGYISNFRFCNGSIPTSYQTSSTTVGATIFSSPTAHLTTTSQGATSSHVKILTCQSNRFVDNSNNNFTITRNGDVSVQAFSPFAPSVEYTANTHGGSAYFDGSGDYLSFPASSEMAMGTGDYTIEFWLYRIGGTFCIIDNTGSGGNMQISFIDALYHGSLTAWSYTFTNNVWTHIAFSREGSNLRLFVNGTLEETQTNTNSIGSAVGNNTIGVRNDGFYPLNGYLSNLRVVKGTALYTSNFTPSTTPLTNIANTSLLCNFTNAGILDSTGKNVLETVGDAKISTAQSKFGNSSMAFDGSGDYLQQVNSPILSLDGDFTIEGWVYINAYTAGSPTFFQLGSSTGALLIYVSSSDGNIKTAGTFSLTGGNIGTGAWKHFALVRYGTGTNNVTFYVDGVASGQTTNTSSLYGNASNGLRIGAEYPSAYYLDGYIDDLRITKGIARYVQNFTPPTAAFKDR